ncbi:Anti-sigma regulatory factor (Ser/Thr protein kinase) [Mucilaginibacter gossypiicola]|uniref:Anti-sigma regulatory factor (Ser/Thr protein kinase) n=1 Tax=Mucilaginibacter gossypiicola TaxID=551995 RepID=A0A1H8B7B9_9SPHI|nr:serine/threonine protein kinase [Mucilaginibacter gossypiicola]SEM77747.1 Anti-sigma regulatory factor (Ser/Thr protein kinase) [Mucilaginibacter gossypiicola]
MVDATHISFAADDRSYFSLIKKEIHRLAIEAGMNAGRINELDLIVAEMTSNLYKYSDDGEILMGTFANAGSPYIELISIDNGPGMVNPARMMVDGVSTTNTLGHGLGSMKRLSDTFELYSQPGWGTIVLSRVYSDPEKLKADDDVIIRPIVVSKPGEKTSGDGFVYKKTDKYLKMMLADGLGHGPEANKAINEAAAAFKVFPDYSPTETLRFIHASIKKTRGAVINVVGYHYGEKKWSSAGIGNIAARMFGPVIFKSHMSYNGIVGHNIPNTMNDQQYPADEFNQVMLCSDGIKTRIDLAKYPLMYKYDLSVLAAAIYKDHARKNDDMSVIIAKVK